MSCAYGSCCTLRKTERVPLIFVTVTSIIIIPLGNTGGVRSCLFPLQVKCTRMNRTIETLLSGLAGLFI